jgi:hypothetical protein
MSELLKQLTRQTFDPLVNQPFQVALDPGSLSLDLIECKALGSRQPEEGEREPFSLVFQGPPAPALAQQIYAVTHSSIGNIEIFLVPLGPAKGGMKYEAIFT